MAGKFEDQIIEVFTELSASDFASRGILPSAIYEKIDPTGEQWLEISQEIPAVLEALGAPNVSKHGVRWKIPEPETETKTEDNGEGDAGTT